MTLQPQWITEFTIIAIAHLLAVTSPGPDFAVVLKHAITYGRRAAMITSIGIGTGILIHVAYTLIGIGLVISTTPWLFSLLKLAAGAYLFWIGWQSLRSSPDEDENANPEQQPQLLLSDRKAFVIGFITNGLNPKATLFFLALFSAVVSVDTPTTIKAGYGLYMVVTTMAWFCFFSWMCTSARFLSWIKQYRYLIDRFMGVILIALAIKLVLVDF